MDCADTVRAGKAYQSRVADGNSLVGVDRAVIWQESLYHCWWPLVDAPVDVK